MRALGSRLVYEAVNYLTLLGLLLGSVGATLFLGFIIRGRFKDVHRRLDKVQANQRNIIAELERAFEAAQRNAESQEQTAQATASELKKTLKALGGLKDQKRALVRINKNIKRVHDGVRETQVLGTLGVLPLAYPVLGAAWSIDGFLCRALVDAVKVHRPQVVLELGGGVSTVLIAAALERLRLKDTRHIAVDHLSEYLDACRHNVEIQGFSRQTEFWHCPLDTPSDSSPPWYSGLVERLEGTKIDLLLVDGPPGNLHPEARRPALEKLRPFLNPGALVFLDDVGRSSESRTVELWKKDWPDLEVNVSDHGHQHAKLIVPKA